MSRHENNPLPRGSLIGILGGGQLGQMLTMAATRLGYRTHVYAECSDSPGQRTATFKTSAGYNDKAALMQFAHMSDIVTFEFENVPAGTVKSIDDICPVRPKVKALEIIQDRFTEKSFIRDQEIEVTPFMAVSSGAELESAIKTLGLPLVLKTRRFGYDGKGQAMIRDMSDLKAAISDLNTHAAIAEKFIPFEREVSIIGARDIHGNIRTYPLAENDHARHMLAKTIAPAGGNAGLARNIMEKLLDALDYVGVMAVEFFELADESLLVNEIAPRVHNSGHWTQNAGCVDQFELHIRAITGLPLGNITPRFEVEMINLIGRDVLKTSEFASADNVFIHDYGKKEIKPGRKMGHVNRIVRGL
ncbi:MAG: 5-(carboxyamino)imidazole ribonucleotide synthase [Hyphomonadaceae bacterium]|nr:5-(carboxyamino)imidazole ribonucleotide synthase [Hyphomonadaceae bacterium]